MRCRCDACGRELLVAFSCKATSYARGVTNSAARSAPTNIASSPPRVERLLPNVLSVRHWQRLLGGVLYAATVRIDWATLLRRTFAVDVLECAACHGRLRVLGAVVDASRVRALLERLNLPTDAPPRARARDPSDEDDEPARASHLRRRVTLPSPRSRGRPVPLKVLTPVRVPASLNSSSQVRGSEVTSTLFALPIRLDRLLACTRRHKSHSNECKPNGCARSPRPSLEPSTAVHCHRTSVQTSGSSPSSWTSTGHLRRTCASCKRPFAPSCRACSPSPVRSPLAAEP